MTADDVIDSYVRDVASCLPRAKRNDVALELRSLLGEELAARAAGQVRAPDKAMALELLQGFGRPSEAAMRYHQRVPVIGPADTHHFVIWALAGAVYLSVWATISPDPTVDNGNRLLEWLGALVIVFALMGWWRRQRPRGRLGWKPRPDPDRASRLVALVLGVLSLIPPLMYAAPRAFAETMFLHAIPTSGLVLDPWFQDSPIRAVTVVSLSLQPAAYFWLAAEGRWSVWMRWTFALAYLAVGALLGAHAGLAARELVFVSARANATALPIFGPVGAGMVLCGLYEIYREWSRVRPAPSLEAGRA